MTAIETTATPKYPDVRNYIGGEFVAGNGGPHLDVNNPADGSVIARVPLSARADGDRAVAAAQKAFPAWAEMPIQERGQGFFRYKTPPGAQIHELATIRTPAKLHITNH